MASSTSESDGTRRLLRMTVVGAIRPSVISMINMINHMERHQNFLTQDLGALVNFSFKISCVIENPLSSGVKCRHIFCLLLACFTISAASAGDVDKNSEIPSPLQVITSAFSTQDLYDLNGNIPFSKRSAEVRKRDLHDHDGKDIGKMKEKDKHVPAESKLLSFHTKVSDVLQDESRHFIASLFQRYGNGDTIRVEDLKKVLGVIRLMGAKNEHTDDEHHHHSHDDHDHKIDSSLSEFDGIQQDKWRNQNPGGKHQRSVEDRPDGKSLGRNKSKGKLDDDGVYWHDDHDHCLSVQELRQIFRFNQQKLTAHDFLNLCPALIDQLDAGYCKKRNLSGGISHSDSLDSHLHDHHSHGPDDLHVHEQEESDETQHMTQTVSTKVWFCALLSVSVISLCSIAGIVVIPNTKRTFYNHMLQFLVALAVGTMSGDAMLHLLPHAMLSESHHDNHHHQHDIHGNDTDSHERHGSINKEGMPNHMAALYKGLVALVGIYCFFFLERLFTLFTKHRSGKSQKRTKRRRLRLDENEDGKPSTHMVKSYLEHDEGNTPSCDDMVMVVHPNKALRAFADVSHDALLHQCDESLVVSPSGHELTGVLSSEDHRVAKAEEAVGDIVAASEGARVVGVSPTDLSKCELRLVTDAEITGITKEPEPALPLPSHSHSHLAHDDRGPISSVATMVVVGDMVHNLCDGLAIGAAFAGSVAGGLSTSVAVFCHELPHEIGDFAVLVRSGLTMKKAVCFNLISSIPCFIGTIIGLTVGNVASASLWIFAAVGGMFLYITLVDLVPEMTSVYTKSGEPWFLHLLLQAVGITLGSTIMLIISVSEESLLTVFHD